RCGADGPGAADRRPAGRIRRSAAADGRSWSVGQGSAGAAQGTQTGLRPDPGADAESGRRRGPDRRCRAGEGDGRPGAAGGDPAAASARGAQQGPAAGEEELNEEADPRKTRIAATAS